MDKIIQFWNKTNRWHRTIFIFLIVELRVVPKQQLGFVCNDPALSHPYTGDTITWKWLLVSVAFLPLVVLLITERIYHNDKERSKKQALKWYKEYLYGVLINLTMVQTLKILVGAPRPHFFDTCSPTEASTCSGSEYISSYTCDKGHWVNQSDTSFPSGHTSLAVHTGVFIVYYLHQRSKGRSSNVMVLLTVQVLTISAAVYCSISRITDRRHHWWDVLTGAILAIPIVIYTISNLCKNFKCPPLKREGIEQDNTAVESSLSNGIES